GSGEPPRREVGRELRLRNRHDIEPAIDRPTRGPLGSGASIEIGPASNGTDGGRCDRPHPWANPGPVDVGEPGLPGSAGSNTQPFAPVPADSGAGL
ncbi:MAG: hypothetical protein AVDCRST_MAG87-3276, partial [uncultured Thermomicrobiales bacterium]